MQISLSFPVDIEVSDPESLRRIPSDYDLLLSDELMETYLPTELADEGVVGGEVRLRVRNSNQYLRAVFWFPAPPSGGLLQRLEEDVVAQLDDGIGEGGFECTIGGQAAHVQAITTAPPIIDLIEDGRMVPLPPVAAIAARDGDLEALRSEIPLSEPDCNVLYQGFSPLHYAILNGHVEAVGILLRAGADPNLADQIDTRPLEHCALSNEMDDDRSAEVMLLLLQAGATLEHVSNNGESAKSYALSRGKTRTAEILASVLP